MLSVLGPCPQSRVSQWLASSQSDVLVFSVLLTAVARGGVGTLTGSLHLIERRLYPQLPRALRGPESPTSAFGFSSVLGLEIISFPSLACIWFCFCTFPVTALCLRRRGHCSVNLAAFLPHLPLCPEDKQKAAFLLILESFKLPQQTCG